MIFIASQFGSQFGTQEIEENQIAKVFKIAWSAEINSTIAMVTLESRTVPTLLNHTKAFEMIEALPSLEAYESMVIKIFGLNRC